MELNHSTNYEFLVNYIREKSQTNKQKKLAKTSQKIVGYNSENLKKPTHVF